MKILSWGSVCWWFWLEWFKTCEIVKVKLDFVCRCVLISWNIYLIKLWWFVNSITPGDVMWHHTTWWTLVYKIWFHCLIIPSHYWNKDNLSPIRYYGIHIINHMRAISLEMLKIAIAKMCLKIAHFELYFPGSRVIQILLYNWLSRHLRPSDMFIEISCVPWLLVLYHWLQPTRWSVTWQMGDWKKWPIFFYNIFNVFWYKFHRSFFLMVWLIERVLVQSMANPQNLAQPQQLFEFCSSEWE